jgi:hypothetical protein
MRNRALHPYRAHIGLASVGIGLLGMFCSLASLVLCDLYQDKGWQWALDGMALLGTSCSPDEVSGLYALLGVGMVAWGAALWQLAMEDGERERLALKQLRREKVRQ